MLEQIRVVKIDSDLSSEKFQSEPARVQLEIINNSDTGKGDLEGKIVQYTDLTISYSLAGEGEDQSAEIDEENIIGSIKVRFEFIFHPVELSTPLNELDSDQMRDYSVKAMPIIYPHMYQKIEQLLSVHGTPYNPLPLELPRGFQPEQQEK